jgi:hypothetical protein
MRIPALSILLLAGTLTGVPGGVAFATPSSSSSSSLATAPPRGVGPALRAAAPSDLSGYAARETRDPAVATFTGGSEVVIIGGGTLTVVLLVLLILIL